VEWIASALTDVSSTAYTVHSFIAFLFAFAAAAVGDVRGFNSKSTEEKVVAAVHFGAAFIALAWAWCGIRTRLPGFCSCIFKDMKLLGGQGCQTMDVVDQQVQDRSAVDSA
jgi:hypothetical protein